MADQKIVDYIRKGVQQGFNLAYIKDVLLKHGYQIDDVESAVAEAITPEQPSIPQRKSSIKPVVIGFSIMIALVAIFFLFNSDQDITGQAISVEMAQELTVQEYLDQLGELSEDIDFKEDTIDRQIELIKDLTFTVEEKEQVIEEIDRLYADIKKEREEVKGLLIELLEQIVDRFNTEVIE